MNVIVDTCQIFPFSILATGETWIRPRLCPGIRWSLCGHDFILPSGWLTTSTTNQTHPLQQKNPDPSVLLDQIIVIIQRYRTRLSSSAGLCLLSGENEMSQPVYFVVERDAAVSSVCWNHARALCCSSSQLFCRIPSSRLLFSTLTSLTWKGEAEYWFQADLWSRRCQLIAVVMAATIWQFREVFFHPISSSRNQNHLLLRAPSNLLTAHRRARHTRAGLLQTRSQRQLNISVHVSLFWVMWGGH